MLRVALAAFLEQGFDQATMEGIATSAGMSKRTVYARYDDKAALFCAAIGHAVERYTIPRDLLETAAADSLADTLMNVARLRIANLSHPESISLQRVLTAQSYRFPELFHAAFERSAGPTIAFLEQHFTRHAERGDIRLDDPRQTVTAFLSLVVGGPARIIISGNPLAPEKVERHLRFAVDLFLNGIRSRAD